MSRSIILRASGAVCVMMATASAQVVATWTRVMTPTNPTVRGVMAFDESRGVVVMAGESTGIGPEVWEFNGNSWALRPVQPMSQARWIFYDARRGSIRGFGYGQDEIGSRFLTLTGNSWVVDSTSSASYPAVSFAWDSARSTIVGRHVGGTWSGTWEWTGLGDPVLRTLGGPRGSGPFCYHASAGHTLMFGGATLSGSQSSETWLWNGSYWIDYLGSPFPPARWGHVMAYDSIRQVTVLHGGWAGQYLQDTWEWNGSSWREVVPTTLPPARSGAAMVFDGLRNYCVYYGGSSSQGPTNETWIYRAVPATSATFAAQGLGCPGPVGTPALDALNGQRPRLGRTLPLAMTNLPSAPFNLPFGVIGFDNQSWNGLPLPLHLNIFGMPGCYAHLSPFNSETLTNNQGVANWSIPIPYYLPLVGQHIYVQGAVLAPGWNAGGMVFSNSCHGVVGTQ